MAKAILMSGGPGGIGSDEVTASKAHVLQGYRTVTTDSDDEVVEGTIKSINTADDNYNINKSNAFGIDEFGRMWIDMPHGNGYYHRYDNKPHTCIDSAKLGDATADKVLRGCTFTSKNGIAVQGTMANRGNVVNTVEFVNAYWDSKFLARMEQGFYSQNGQYKPCVAIPYAILAQVAGVDRSKMLDTLTIAGKQGQIKSINTQDSNYRLNKATAFGIDNWSDTRNPVFWIDFPHGNGYYHRADNHPHTCIDAVALGDATPDKVMRGFTATSKNGVKFAGTMPDLQSGRTVFNGATFDGILASGVANKGFYLNNNYYAYWLADFYKYAGIYDGGINLAISTGWPAFRSRRVGCVLSQSINVTPFRSIVISYHAKADIEGKPYASLEAHVSLASGRSLVNVEGKQIDSIRMLKQTFASVQITRNGQMVIDVSDINDFIFLSFGAYCNYDKTSDKFEGAIQITKIDFLN